MASSESCRWTVLSHSSRALPAIIIIRQSILPELREASTVFLMSSNEEMEPSKRETIVTPPATAAAATTTANDTNGPSSSTPVAGTSATSSELTDYFTTEELSLIENLLSNGVTDTTFSPQQVKDFVRRALPAIPAKLILKLRQWFTLTNAGMNGDWNNDDEYYRTVQTVAKALHELLEEQLAIAKDTLTGLLNAGEVRKLDGLIGKAGREGKLDAAFFHVLALNLQNAIMEEKQLSPESIEQISREGSARKSQILQHIYTRCQEEMEKTIEPSMALMNKLLRTDQESIRANLYKHYLTPQPNVIESPDGKKIELQGGGKVLVSLNEFITAIGNAVKQIRTVETAGGTDRESAAAMVEACRKVAMEARIVIGQHYGTESAELRSFEKGLQPVFRPSSPESPYIQGVN